MSQSFVQKIAEHWVKHREYIRYNHKLLNIYQGQLKPYLEESIREEFTSETAIAEMVQRAPTINILRSVVDKLAKIYALPVGRVAKDQQRLDTLVESLELDSVMSTADEMLTLHKACFLEPFMDQGQMQLRVLPMDRAIPYSDDKVNPLRPTAVIKLVGREQVGKNEPNMVTSQGVLGDTLGTQDEDILLVYTDNLIYLIHSGGEPMPLERLQEYTDAEDQIIEIDGVPALLNPFGRIPMEYLNRSKFNLIPPPDTDLADMTFLVPKLLADLNYTVKHQASSVLIARDISLPDNIKREANTVIPIKTDADAASSGELSALKPEVDISPVLALIQGQLIMWFESRGLKPGSAGKASEQRASGLAKIIDSADAASERFAKIKILAPFEKRLLKLIVLFHNFMVGDGILIDELLPQDMCIDRIDYPDQRPTLSINERFDQVDRLFKNEMITKEQAIRYLFPDWPEKVINKWVEALEAEEVELRDLLQQSSAINSAENPTESESDGEEQASQPSDTIDSEPNEIR